MPIIQINTPNLVSDLVEIELEKDSIEDSIPLNFDNFINDVFWLKPNQNCDVLSLIDYTNYQELSSVNINDLIITASLRLGNEVICDYMTINPNSTTVFDNLNKDGVYSAEIKIIYSIEELGIINTYSKSIKRFYRKDCCTKKINSLVDEIESNISSIGSKMIKYSMVGRPVKTLKKSCLELSNLLWVSNFCYNPCIDYSIISDLLNKIKKNG